MKVVRYYGVSGEKIMDSGDRQINRPNFKSYLCYSLKLGMSLKLP